MSPAHAAPPPTTRGKGDTMAPLTLIAGLLAMGFLAGPSITAAQPIRGQLTRRRQGARRRDFRKAWGTACLKAGLPGRLRHDFRRTAARNLVNAGVSERIAMAILGHKTRAMFDRYHIVSPGDLQAATRRLAEQHGHVSGHVRPALLD